MLEQTKLSNSFVKDISSCGILNKTSVSAIQSTYSHWQKASDLSLAQLSRLVAYAPGYNPIQLG